MCNCPYSMQGMVFQVVELRKKCEEIVKQHECVTSFSSPAIPFVGMLCQ